MLMMTEKKVTVKIKLEIAIISFSLNFFHILNRRFTKKIEKGLSILLKVSYICTFPKKMIQKCGVYHKSDTFLFQHIK